MAVKKTKSKTSVGSKTGKTNARGGIDKVSNKEARANSGSSQGSAGGGSSSKETVKNTQSPTNNPAPVTPTNPTGRTVTVEPYDSKTGKGTLSYYARQAGTTVDNLAKLNNISDVNTVQTGAVLNLPAQGATQSTGPYRAEVTKNTADFQATLDGIKTKALEIKGKLDARKAEEANAAALATKTDAVAGQGQTTQVYSPEEETLRSETDKEVKRVWDTYERIQKYADDAHMDMIESIKRSSAARAEQMKDTNARQLAAKDVSNMRQGRSRYTSELATGILVAEEYDGQARLVEIEAELVTALAEAESARANDKTDAFNDAWDRVQKAKKDMNDQIESNYKIAIEQEKLIIEREKEARTAQKDALDMMLDHASAAAPGLAAKMKEFKSASERTAFIQAYAERVGVDADVLLGEITKSMQDSEYKELQMANIENQIYNRNRTEDRLQRGKDEDEEEEQEEPETSNVISGITKFSDIEDPKIREKVKYQLSQYGLFETKPPQWFIDEYEQQAVGEGDTMAGEAEINQAWNDYRKQRGT